MWWKVFDLVPGFVYAGIIAVLLTVFGVSYLRMTHAQHELATYRAQVAENTRIAEAQARAKEHEMRNQVDRIAHNAAQKQTVLAARAATAELVSRELRDEVGRLNARSAPADPGAAAYAREAAVARELLGTCADRYRDVATHADGLRDQVTGLQDYATLVCAKGVQ